MSKNNGTSARPKMLEWLASAGPSDLAEIDQAVAALEARIATVTGELRGELASLQSLRRVVSLKVNGRPPKAPSKAPHKRPASADDVGALMRERTERRQRIAAFLGAEGPTPGGVIASRLDLPAQGIAGTLNHPWFEPTSQGYRLTATGRKEALTPTEAR